MTSTQFQANNHFQKVESRKVVLLIFISNVSLICGCKNLYSCLSINRMRDEPGWFLLLVSWQLAL